MRKSKGREPGVSEVVGEMLMIGLVLLLAAVFTSQLSNYLPSERSPVVTIMMSNDTGGNVTLWHKGGDWVKEDTLTVIISNTFTHVRERYSYTSPNFTFVPDPAEPKSSTFDVGGNITVVTGAPFDRNTTVVLATDRAVLFSGLVSGGQS